MEFSKNSVQQTLDEKSIFINYDNLIPNCDERDDAAYELAKDIMDSLFDEQLECEDYGYACGASKAVIIPSVSDFVIKIPFIGCGYCDCDGIYENESDEEDYDEDGYYTDYFENAGDKTGSNYCVAEVQEYNMAKEYGIEEFFAKTEILGTVYEEYFKKPILITSQEKVLNVGDNKNTIQQENEYYNLYTNTISSHEIKNLISRYKSVSNRAEYDDNFQNWLKVAYGLYGKEKMLSFLDYIEWYRPHVGKDLHCENYGYRKSDGTPCLLDFCGFQS